MTLYRHFPSKEALCEGLVAGMCEYMREGLENAPSAGTGQSGANRLADELRVFASALNAPDALALCRLLVAEGWRFPDLVGVFNQSGMRIIRRRIAALLESDGIPADASTQVSGEVAGLALGDAYQRAILGIVEAGDGEAFARQIAAAVTHGVQPENLAHAARYFFLRDLPPILCRCPEVTTHG
ncbi:MAG: TetR/AcrR family transcriptional regulator [Steroidobacteraceae bacterium]